MRYVDLPVGSVVVERYTDGEAYMFLLLRKVDDTLTWLSCSVGVCNQLSYGEVELGYNCFLLEELSA